MTSLRHRSVTAELYAARRLSDSRYGRRTPLHINFGLAKTSNRETDNETS